MYEKNSFTTGETVSFLSLLETENGIYFFTRLFLFTLLYDTLFIRSVGHKE